MLQGPLTKPPTLLAIRNGYLSFNGKCRIDVAIMQQVLFCNIGIMRRVVYFDTEHKFEFTERIGAADQPPTPRDRTQLPNESANDDDSAGHVRETTSRSAAVVSNQTGIRKLNQYN